MCGRFSLFADLEYLISRFGILNSEEFDFVKRYNIAPSQDVFAIIKSDEGNKAGFLKWGLVPVWAKDERISHKMINARAETVDEKPSFKYLG